MYGRLVNMFILLTLLLKIIISHLPNISYLLTATILDFIFLPSLPGRSPPFQMPVAITFAIANASAFFGVSLTSPLPLPWQLTSLVHRRSDYCSSYYCALPDFQVKVLKKAVQDRVSHTTDIVITLTKISASD